MGKYYDFVRKIEDFESEESFNQRRELSRKEGNNFINKKIHHVWVLKEDEYQCGMCGNVYEKEWTDEEALQESEENFGVEMANNTDSDTVCDDCYKKIDPKEHPHQVLTAQQEHFVERN